MKSHELARRLLDLPDLLVATHANNHTFLSGEPHANEPLTIDRLRTWLGPHILIGNQPYIDNANMSITETYYSSYKKVDKHVDEKVL